MMEKILIIEDQEHVRTSIRDMLQYAGYEVFEASDGFDGIEQVERSAPDLIISDIMMPGMSGYQVLRQLQNNPETSSIPFIFLTARVELSDIREGMNLGADDYVTKPFKLNDLLGAVNRRLEKKRRQNEKIKNITHNITKYIPHELRTPLVSIAGFSDIILNDFDSLEPEEIYSMVGRIKHGSIRLHETIEKFLTYMETELILKNAEYRKEFTLMKVDDPVTLLHNVIMTKAAKKEREKDVKISLAENYQVFITHSFLQLILSELLDNSIKFSCPGSSIRVNSSCENEYFKITIEDEGTGMTPEEIAASAAFTQFNRDYVQQSGIGLGLAIIKNLMEIFGGKIKIESSKGEFTRVSVLLRKT